jgi:NADPH:quinone reductase-like Zn-dependent oxidoreductase
MQKAIVQAGTGEAEVMTLQDMPVLTPGEGQVLVRIYASTVNPFEWKLRSGMMDGMVPGKGYAEPHSSPATERNTMIPGSDAAGIIEKVGPGVTGLKVGDPVFASINRGPISANVDGLNGAYAEFGIASPDSVIPKPASMTYVEAAGLGTATITGVGSVMDMGVQEGQRVLILGAAGGVGSAALQAAKARGAYVVGTASSRHEDYLQSLGIDEYHDYRKGTWQEDIRDIDVVIDTVGKDNLMLALKTVKPGAKVVGFNGSLSQAECEQYNVVCGSRGIGGRAVLEEVSRMAEAGTLTVHVDETFPLAEAYAAQEENRNGGTQGKIVLVVDPEHANER